MKNTKGVLIDKRYICIDIVTTIYRFCIYILRTIIIHD